MRLIAGIDIGSRSTKIVLLGEDGAVRATYLTRTRPPFAELVDAALDAATASIDAIRDDVSYIATTGFGRSSYPNRDIQITDVTTAAHGAARLFPGTRSVIDIGSQSSRAIRIDPGGRVREFKSNDKCAAGAGGFVERAARYLEVSMEDAGRLSMQGNDPVTISSICAVLAESEIINHVSQGSTVPDILRGIHNSLAERALALLKRIGVERELTLVGGIARQQGMVKALAEAVGFDLNIPEVPEIVNALGAAHLALRRIGKAAA
jgi:(R)-2-hydroxyacyl-CoA dehydratese activating ATPase